MKIRNNKMKKFISIALMITAIKTSYAYTGLQQPHLDNQYVPSPQLPSKTNDALTFTPKLTVSLDNLPRIESLPLLDVPNKVTVPTLDAPMGHYGITKTLRFMPNGQLHPEDLPFDHASFNEGVTKLAKYLIGGGIGIGVLAAKGYVSTFGLGVPADLVFDISTKIFISLFKRYSDIGEVLEIVDNLSTISSTAQGFIGGESVKKLLQEIQLDELTGLTVDKVVDKIIDKYNYIQNEESDNQLYRSKTKVPQSNITQIPSHYPRSFSSLTIQYQNM
jgi:hypothetical protein